MGFTERLGHVAVTVLGIFLAVTPVTLWIAWTATQVVCIMLVALVSAALLALLTDLQQKESQNQSGKEAAGGNFSLPEEFIEEVHRLFPLTYHHSRLESSRFRQAMRRMSRLIDESRSR